MTPINTEALKNMGFKEKVYPNYAEYTYGERWKAEICINFGDNGFEVFVSGEDPNEPIKSPHCKTMEQVQQLIELFIESKK